MLENWDNCRDILCIRADNMGDLLMSSPAIRALKETFGARITLLTSSMASGITPYIPQIDNVIVCDLPWVKISDTGDQNTLLQLLERLKEKKFDAAVVFSVYSQNPLPAAMLAYLAEIPNRLSYCRENPYDLLTHWVPDREPFSEIKHQVRRDLDLVNTIGAFCVDDRLFVQVPDKAGLTVQEKLKANGINPAKPWFILHAGVSEKKREYPVERWVETARKLISHFGCPVLFTGSASEKELTDKLQAASGHNSYSMAGLFTLEEFISLVQLAKLAVSVNTSTIHIAAAVNTPVIVLYALTNPQHFPWRARGKVLPFDVPESERSKNEIIKYVTDRHFSQASPIPHPDEIVDAAREILNGDAVEIPEMADLFHNHV
jgi:ADP-heptose:LPS heptosyltransferase